MQTMSTAMATLLKSGKQIGSNRQTAEVIIGDSNEIVGWTGRRDLRAEITGSWQDGSFVTRSDGKILVNYSKASTGEVYLSVVDSEDDIFYSDNESATNEWVFASFGANQHSRLFKLQNGSVLLFVSYTGTVTIPSALKIYKSDNGLGTDFTLLSTAYEYQILDFSKVFNLDTQVIGQPIQLENGRILIPWQGFHYYASGYAKSVAIVSYSDDNGLTWTNKLLPTSQYLRKNTHRGIAKFGNQLVCSIGTQTTFRFYSSNDNGENWNEIGSISGTEIVNGAVFYMGNGYSAWIDAGGEMYIRPDTDPLPLDSTMFERGAGTTWGEMVVDLVGDDNREVIWLTEGNKLAYCGTSVYGGSTTSFINGGIQAGDKTYQPKSITINRSKGMAGGLTLELDNKSAILAPDGTANPQLLWPNKEVVVKQGYGQELLKTFTGLIDSISMSRDEQGVASVTVSARDKLKVALDHLIRNAEFLYTLTYTNMLVEDIWKNLVGLAGLTYNTVEATGLTISEKTFSWETYADAFSWLDEIAGFETYCDEDGLLNFVWDGRPATVTTAYSFVEGVDITRLGYEINDQDLFYTVAVYGKLPADPEVEGSQDSVIYFAKQLPQATYWNIPSGKVLRIDAPDADTQAKCEIIADKAIYLMQTRARQVTFSTIGIPHLQRGDFIQVEESSTTISEIYRITDITTQQGPDGYGMTLTCYYHAAPEV